MRSDPSCGGSNVRNQKTDESEKSGEGERQDNAETVSFFIILRQFLFCSISSDLFFYH